MLCYFFLEYDPEKLSASHTEFQGHCLQTVFSNFDNIFAPSNSLIYRDSAVCIQIRPFVFKFWGKFQGVLAF